MSSEEFQKNFRTIVESIFNKWHNLRLAVEHGMGGPNGQKVAIDIMDYTFKYCISNENITQGELEEVIEDLMDQEFNTLCDDNSIQEISRNLLRYKRMCLQGLYTEIETEISKLPQVKDWLNPNVKITYTPIDGEDSSSDEGGASSDDDMDIDTEGAADISNRRVTRSQTLKQDDLVETEPGWTTVRTRRK